MCNQAPFSVSFLGYNFKFASPKHLSSAGAILHVQTASVNPEQHVYIKTQHSVVPFSNRQPRPSFQLATSASSDQFYSATLLLPLFNTTIPVYLLYYLFSPSDSFFSSFPNSSYSSCFLCPTPCRYTQHPLCCPK